MKAETWCGCEILQPDDPRYQAYAQKVKTVTSNVWHDPVGKKVFGRDQTYVNLPKDTNQVGFYTTKDDFLNNVSFNETYLYNQYKKPFERTFGPDGWVKTDEMIYWQHPVFEKFRDTKILIIGGGPTTKYVDWKPESYDCIVSCNYFFRSPKLQNVRVDFATVCDAIPILSDEFRAYTDASGTVFNFQVFNSDRRTAEQLSKFSVKYPGRSVFTHPRYRSVEGTMSRTLVPIVLMKPREIHIVGMDGLLKTDKQGKVCDHAFQPGKRYSGTLDFHLYKRQFVILWDYILNDIGKGIRFQNLGEGHPQNQWTDISRQEFPLEV